MRKLTLLPNWIFTNPRPSIYDTDSGTAIEMVAKVYGAMKDLQENYNEFTEEINKHIEDYEKGIIEDFNCFKNKIIETVENYITSIDMKIELQDKNIEEAISYMKDNLTSTIATEITALIESGEVDEAILNALKEVEETLNPRVTDLEELSNNILTELNKNIANTNTNTNNIANLVSELETLNSNVNVLTGEVTEAKTGTLQNTNDIAYTKAHLSEAEFKSNMLLKTNELDLDLLCVEYFDKASSIDSVLNDGADVIKNYLDLDNHQINLIESASNKTIVLPLITTEKNPTKAWAKLEKEGHINIYVSSDNGVTYTSVDEETITNLLGANNNIRIKLELQAGSILKNLCVGFIY